MDMKKIAAAAHAVKLPIMPVASSGGSLSFNIVNSESNGKRIRFSKGLALAVGITESADMLPIKDEGLLMVAENLPYGAACPVKLNGKGGNAKIAYNSGMVALLTNVFELDFTKHVSMSFSDISIEKLDDGTPVALIRMSKGQPEDTTSTGER